jgi:iron complex outermembrane recepter protein
MYRTNLLRGASACVLVLSSALRLHAQESLPTIDIGSAGPGPATNPVPLPPTAPAPEAAPSAPPGFSPEKKALPVYREPTGQTFTSVKAEDFRDAPLSTITDLLEYSPGMSFKQGNGPRDVVVSIRGSSARNGFGVRNIVLLEDGFSVTQPDGLSRTDLTDPHAYGAVDVYRGPSSALFGNFANGGAINFRTRTGAEIDGVEIGGEYGSYAYINNFTAIGKKYDNFDIAAFVSDVRAESWTQHTQYNTQSVNLTARYQITPDDLIVFKGIHNELFGNLSARLSLNQFYLNSFQQGCLLLGNAGSLTPAGYLSRSWCGQSTVPLNGIAGATRQIDGDMAGFHRNDRRDVFGLRWEHDFDKDTKWRTQVIYDDKNIIQPTGGTSSLEDEPAINASTDVTRHAVVDGHDVTSYAGFYFNRTRYFAPTLNVLPFGDGAYGATIGRQNGLQQNLGARARVEAALSPTVTGVLGLAAEQTRIAALNESFTYSSNGSGALATPPAVPIVGFQPIAANHTYWNFAPEASVSWQARPDVLLRARASSGYGSPYVGQLFVTSTGFPGDNSSLKTQRNTGFDIGGVYSPFNELKLSLTGFYEWYQNEQLTVAGTVNTAAAYTFNAPGSAHRGVEATIDYRPLPGWRLLANYTYNNQIFTDFVETLGAAGGATGLFDRAGYRIPGVAPHELTARAGYDQPFGPLKGLGAYAEYLYKSSYYLDNGNVVTAPSYGLVNLNVHYNHDEAIGWLRSFSLFFEVRNVFNRTYIASANDITNPAGKVNGVVVQGGYAYASQFTSGSIYAGNPRLFQAGFKVKF